MGSRYTTAAPRIRVALDEVFCENSCYVVGVSLSFTHHSFTLTLITLTHYNVVLSRTPCLFRADVSCPADFGPLSQPAYKNSLHSDVADHCLEWRIISYYDSFCLLPGVGNRQQQTW